MSLRDKLGVLFRRPVTLALSQSPCSSKLRVTWTAVLEERRTRRGALLPFYFASRYVLRDRKSCTGSTRAGVTTTSTSRRFLRKEFVSRTDVRLFFHIDCLPNKDYEGLFISLH